MSLKESPWRACNPERMHPWYHEGAGFFGAAYLEEYSAVLPPERTLAEVDFVEQVLDLPRGARILDLACGHGRHAVELAGRGYEVTGQDLSSYFLGEGQRKALDRGVSVRWVERDMRTIDADEPYDAVISMFTGFGYFESDEENVRVLSAVAGALVPGGRFLLDVVNRERIMRVYREKDWTRLDNGVTVLTERHFDFAGGRNQETRTWIFPNGRERSLRVDLRLYTTRELRTMLSTVGLEVDETFGGFDGGPLDLDAPECILVCTRV